MDAKVLKGLNNQIASRKQEVNLLKEEISSKNKELNLKQQEIVNLKKKLDELTPKEITLSEHAIVRYFERVAGFDLDQIKEVIVTDEIANLIKTLGNGTYPNKNGYKVVVRNNTIVTIET